MDGSSYAAFEGAAQVMQARYRRRRLALLWSDTEYLATQLEDMAPAAQEPSTDEIMCTMCSHVFDADKDGAGLEFKDLSDGWDCPDCMAMKHWFQLTTIEVETAPTQDRFVCGGCGLEYDPATDEQHFALDALPDRWSCPRCRAPTDAFFTVHAHALGPALEAAAADGPTVEPS